jgi:hypothetical protein
MEYPFKFKELLLTDKVLDVLGFSKYWNGCGDFGDRRLDLGGVVEDKRLTSKNEYPKYFIQEVDEIDDPESGYGYGEPEYSSRHFCTKGFEKRIYFLHEMYEDILQRRTPEEVEKFIEITKKEGVNMFPYIESWIKYKER